MNNASFSLPAAQPAPLELVEESPLNPRTNFDQETQEKLIESLREHGFTLSVLLCRPLLPGAVAAPVDPAADEGKWHLVHPDTRVPYSGTAGTREYAEELAASTYAQRFELADGARRRRAARVVGLQMVPVTVRELSDMDILKIALITSIQKENLSPIEEANGYRAMIERGAAVEEIAAAVGVTVKTVQQTLSLVRLQGEAKAAVEARELPRSTAYFIARIPDEKTRAEAAADVLHPLAAAGPLSHRETRVLMHRKYIRALRSVPWDMADAELVPVRLDSLGERCFGGACTDCQSNTMNVSDEEREEGKHRRHGDCLNIACFNAKTDAVWTRFQAKETDAERNRRALSREECEDIFSEDGTLRFGTPFVELAADVPADMLRPGVEPGPWKELLEGTGIEVLVARDPGGKKRELVLAELAKTAITKLNKQLIFRGDEREEQQAKERMNDDQHKAATLEEKAAQEADAKFRRELNDAIRRELRAKAVALGHAPPSLWRTAALHEMVGHGVSSLTLSARECGDLDELSQWVAQATEGESLALYLELLVFGRASIPDASRLEAVAKPFGLDLKALETSARLKADGGHEGAQKGRKKGVTA